MTNIEITIPFPTAPERDMSLSTFAMLGPLLNWMTTNPPHEGRPRRCNVSHSIDFAVVQDIAKHLNIHVAKEQVQDLDSDDGLMTLVFRHPNDTFYHSMKPGDALVWEDPNIPTRHAHVWTIEGIHLGGTGQESVIELKNASHNPAVAYETNITNMMVPEVLLRGCKLMRAKSSKPVEAVAKTNNPNPKGTLWED